MTNPLKLVKPKVSIERIEGIGDNIIMEILWLIIECYAKQGSKDLRVETAIRNSHTDNIEEEQP